MAPRDPIIEANSPYGMARERLQADPRRWLVTGAGGFIGSHLVEELLRLDQSVAALDNFSSGRRANLEAACRQANGAGHLDAIEGDIEDPDTCRQATRGAHFILHHAAIGSVPGSINNPLGTHRTNVTGFLNMLVAAREAEVGRFVYASSSSVYGDCPELPQREERIGEPLSPYAASKRINEIYAGVFTRNYGLRTAGLRYFNVFGPRQDSGGAYAAVIPAWITALRHHRPVTIYGDGETTRDFCHVANVVQANLLAAVHLPETLGSTVCNIACGERTSLNALFQALRASLARRLPEIAAQEALHAAFRPGDIAHSVADTRLARSLLGYLPTHNLSTGLEEAMDWYIAQG